MGRLTILVVLFIAILSGGCSILGIEGSSPPYLILSIKVVSGSGANHDIGALLVNIINSADRAIASLKLEFDLYDTDGIPRPRVGNNHIRSVLENTIPPGERLEMEVVLDEPFTRVPDVTLTATRFCITAITYDDGSRWQDPLRLNVVMSDSVETERL